MSARQSLGVWVALAAGAVLAVVVAAQEGLGLQDQPSPFAPSLLQTTTGGFLDPETFYPAEDCGECHVAHYEQWDGSMHSRAHEDALYLAFANLARKEGGDDLYRFCSSCHAPAAVATGEIPGKPGKEHTFLTNEGVTCDACHRVAGFKEVHHGGGANASIVLDGSENRFGPLRNPEESRFHKSSYSELYTRSEFCSNCHTLTHPINGTVIENTYEEWKKGPFAKAGIQCQDCHMRTVEQALVVAETMKPIKTPGVAYEDGDERPDVHAHTFVGGNTNAALVGAGDDHAAAARRRLQTAATIALDLPAEARAGGPLAITVAVTNVAAGHAIPTSITELRQVWIDLRVADAAGEEIYCSGAVDATGRVDPEAVMYNSVLVDKDGAVTFLPWRAVKIAREKLIPPRETLRERYAIPVPAGTRGPLQVRAVLRYRSAPQDVLDRLFGKGKLPVETVDMAKAKGRIAIAKP